MKTGLLTIGQKIPVSGQADIQTIKDAIESILQKSKAEYQVNEESRYYFQAGIFRLISNLNIFLAVDEGIIEIQQQSNHKSVHIRASVSVLFMVCLLAVVFFGFPIFKAGNLGFLAKICIELAIFSYFFFGNILIFKFRFRRRLIREISLSLRDGKS